MCLKHTKKLYFTVKKVISPVNEDRRKNNIAVAAIRASENATGKTAKFSNVMSNIVDVVDIVDISLINHPVKFDIKIICALQTKMIKTVWIKQASNFHSWTGRENNLS